MSMRPIDLQSMIPRSYEVNKTQGIDAAKPEMQQQQFVKQFDEEIRHQEQFVKESNKSEKGTVDKDARHSSKNSGSGQGRRKKRDAQKKDPSPQALAARGSASMLDIQV